MAGVNRVIILGRLGRDPELRYTDSGKAVANFSLATSEIWGQGESRQERTEWHRVIAWGKTAELCSKYLSKGRQVYLEGRLQTREWMKDDEKRYTTEIVAQSVHFIGSKGESEKREDPPPPEDDRSIPF